MKTAPSRLDYLDGLRGFAALEVLILHYLGVFAPAADQIKLLATSPTLLAGLHFVVITFMVGGALAVSLFFLISGTVLTFSFQAGGRNFATQAARRAVRLGVPSIVSICLGILCFSILPDMHITAAKLMGGNAGMAAEGPNHIDIAAIANEIFMGSMVFGHDGATLLPHRAVQALGLLDLSHSFNSPLWTLHLEFYGSVIVLGLVTLEKHLTPALHRLLCIVLVAPLLANPLALFILGYFAAKSLQTKAWKQLAKKFWFKGLGLFSLLLGLGSLAQTAPSGLIRIFRTYRDSIHLPMQIDLLHAFGQYGAMLIFFGILVLRVPQNLLASKPGKLLGRYSFSIYLVHFPILYTLGAGLYVVLQPAGAGIAVIGAVFISLLVTLIAIIIFEYLVDQRAIVLSRRLNFRPLAAKPAITPAAS